MAGATRHDRGAYAHARLALALAAAAIALALLALSAGAVSPPQARAQGCESPPGLAPDAPGPTRFTMMVRINTQGNVDTWTNANEAKGGLGDRIRPQDIFVINTRFGGSSNFPATTDAVANQLANNLRAAFPCNRIMALNGTGIDPAAAGYAFSLINNPNVSALLTDYERMDWEAGRLTDPSRAPWVDQFAKAFPMLRGWNASFAGAVAANPAGAPKRTGLVPQDISSWNFGQVAQNLDKQNKRLGSPHLGPLAVQTQDACADAGAAGFNARIKNLRLSYKFKTITQKIHVKGRKKPKTVTRRRKLKPQARPLITNLGMEISFNENPVPTSSMAIMKTSAATADSCIPAGLQQGAGAFFFFASDDAMRLLFQQPNMGALRPATAQAASKGGSGGVVPGGV